MNQRFFIGFALALSAVVAWGIQLPIAKDAFVAVDPFHLTSIRYLIATACLVPFLVLREGWAALSYRGGVSALGIGVVGMCWSPMGAFVGMSLSSAEHCVVIGSLQPAITVLALWLVKRHRPAGFTLACVIAAFLGVVLVVTEGNLEFVKSTRQLIGDLIMLFGACCWVLYTAGVANLRGWSTWRVTVLTMIPGTVATLLVTMVLVVLGASRTPSLEQVSSVGFALAYLAFIGVLYSMLAWNFGARRIGLLNSSLLVNFMPVVTFVYRAAQGHPIKTIEVAGAALVVSALIANNVYLRRRHVREISSADC